jgi:hypothetical protein
MNCTEVEAIEAQARKELASEEFTAKVEARKNAIRAARGRPWW